MAGPSPSAPPFRKLRTFAIDPSLQTDLEFADLNVVTIKVPWADLEPNPSGKAAALRGKYLEVIDIDPASQCAYPPVNLHDHRLIAQEGLSPSESNPQFHQQMVYAVAMMTIRNFEKALGRPALWAERALLDKQGNKVGREFVQHLRIYPHALREANAYYSPAKKALLFGYFPASTKDAREHLPNGLVFTCLSFDIVAHEVTHALLDGQYPRFIESSNPDVLAFHEAFADLVAIFQHFTFPEILRHQIAQTRADLGAENLLAKLAIQFGKASSRHNALRDALGATDPKTGQWTPRTPDPLRFAQTHEPHARGAILVAAVFEAFVAIYKYRTKDLLRIATGGSGELPPGALHPDLVNRLAQDAAKIAQHILNICIRALDYCPSVDITFGDYLRALITADFDAVADDEHAYRSAFIKAFRERGIYPLDARTLSEEALLWQPPKGAEAKLLQRLMPEPYALRRLVHDLSFDEGTPNKKKRKRQKEKYFWDRTEVISQDLPSEEDRYAIYMRKRRHASTIHQWLQERSAALKLKYALGIDFDPQWTFEVHSVRLARRVKPSGDLQTDLIVVITQQKPVHLKTLKDGSWAAYREQRDQLEPSEFFIFRGSCTLIIDADQATIRYAVVKSINSKNRRQRQARYHRQMLALAPMVGETVADHSDDQEPFAMVHRHHGAPEEWYV